MTRIYEMYLIIDFQVGLDIDNCITFYINFADNLLARLRNDYNGICFNGCLILNVIEVIKTSECMFNHPTLPTLGSLSVVFRACVVQFSPGDIIAGLVVRSMKPHSEITMASEYANALIIPTKEGQDTDVLTTDSVVTVNVIGSLASPGAPKISLNVHLFEPQPITHYYPIIPGTQARMNEEGALTRQKYAPVSDSLPSAVSIHGVTIREAALSAMEYFRIAMQEVGAKQNLIPGIVRQLFYPYKIARGPGADTLEFLEVHDMLNFAMSDNVTCLVSCSEFHPFDGRIGVSHVPLDKLPREWIREIAQPANIVVARCLERFIDYLIAGVALARELVNPAKMMATQNLVILQTKKKK